jgi:uncharacterized protein (TIGR02246 family)
MLARAPEEVDRLFTEHMAAGDLDGVVALYEPQAVLVSPEGQATTGAAAIRAALSGLAALRPRFTMTVRKTVEAGDGLAVVYNDWRFTATGRDGRPIDMTGRAVEVLRRQPDGSWRFVVDDPFGR